MAWSFVASNEYNDSNSDSASLTKPTGTLEGDIMYVVLGRDGETAAPTTVPTGWTFIAVAPAGAGVDYAGIYRRVVGSSESSPYIWEWADSDKTAAVVSTFRDDFDTDDPEDVISNTAYVVSNTTLRAAGVTVSEDDSPAIFFGIKQGSSGTFTPPTDFSEHYDAGDTGSDFYFCISSDVLASGATGDIDATISAGTFLKHAFMVVLNPPVVDDSAAGILAVMGL